MPPAARAGDMHVCPMVTGLVPHVGGPILPPGCPTVMIGNMPAARVGDMATCVGPPDVIAMGSPTVLIGNMMAARMGDPPPFERAHHTRRARVRPGGQRSATLHERLATQHALAGLDGRAQIALRASRPAPP